jgi:hypothetical protein
MTAKQLPRREFLMTALAACGAPVFARLVHAQTAAVPQPPVSLGARVAGGYLGAGAEASARSIAEAYLRQIGSETSPAAIEASAAATLRTISATADENAAIAALTEAVQRDFRDQRTVELGGWVLSRTEVELCVLTLLAN